MTTAAMKLVQNHLKGTRQYLITTPLGAKALEGQSLLSGILSLDKGRTNAAQQIGLIRRELKAWHIKKQNTIIIQAHRSVRSSLLRLSTGLPSIVYRQSWGSTFASAVVERVALFHESRRIGLLLEPLGISRERIVESMPYLEDLPGSASLDATMQPHMIAMAPGSIWGTKKWLATSYGKLAEKLLLAFPHYKIILLGSADDSLDCETLLEAMTPTTRQNVINLAGKTSLRDLCALYPKLSLLVANDSSPIHYASAFAVPTVAIFGATTSSMGFGPLAPGSIVIEDYTLECRPCSDHGPRTCPLTHFRCMNNIQAEMVFAACVKILNQETSNA